MAKEKVPFTKSYAELQKIVAWFERDDLDVEEGIKKFEEGMLIVKELKTYLNSLEVRIQELKKTNETLETL
ncbi:MAG: exodeoxyribonuclease VII small subunit [Candidatus Magasanikbacteria bacterium RIFCSPLOWO2_02_FULL_44_11]|uniref:Exodeoxyribonuclease VII small subunit n=2 Tax=Candidatus Magasanikiibacteriota TaxID=1752731 RepID=A0A1F6NA70_9BACT|nr:MAG: exodeoxyribonuclease VII small subunit [Candidatus Magasanikbacteria bacterium RIFCSPHIGHO2_02_FULL_45_10]OGH80761.1 MAG: exodeoxyribonuclease VII small subunit [Candidatus Magasanikbacteria bacterium RIFCSPLOWO2_02_FULL_44_11]